MIDGSMATGESIYIGDGVYLSFDGYQFWLAVNHHENKVVALPPETFRGLLDGMSKHHEFAELIKYKVFG